MRKLLILLFFCICACANKIDAPISLIIPEVRPEMLSSDFWASKMDNPDQPILDEKGIALLNSELGTTHYIVKIEEYDGYKNADFIKNSINVLFKASSREGLVTETGKPITAEFLAKVSANIAIENILDYEPITYGIITERTSQKLLPINMEFHTQENAFFDRLQMSSLDLGTAVAVLWKTKDRNWYYVRSALTVGWVPAQAVGLCQYEDLEIWEYPKNFVIGTKAKIIIHPTIDRKGYINWFSLGVRLPITGKIIDNSTVEVIYPYRGADGWLQQGIAYVSAKDIHYGYVPYTPRNMLTLAFEMLHTPYGWGGMNSYQDCSGFMIQVFNAAGIFLPRNSGQQGNSGLAIYQKTDLTDPLEVLVENGIPGATLIQFPGHIMLYIGDDNGEPFAIHSMWAYEEGRTEPALKTPARVVVSHLYLSKFSERGPYINRTTNIRILYTSIYR